MPIYKTSFEINAPASRVWQVLTDLERYGEWNPQIPLATGTLRIGERINLRLTLPGRPSMDVSATIEEAVPDQVLVWRGHVLAPWFFEGYRRFTIQDIASGRVCLTHVEDIHGLLSPLFSLFMGAPCDKSHHALNEALRARAESAH